MKWITLPAIAALALGLAGCFTAEKPLLTDDNSVAPYQTVSFKGQTSDDVTVLTREGHSYVAVGDKGRLTVRFMPIDRPDWFVMEFSGDDGGGKLLRYFALLKVDFTNRRAEAYKVFTEDGDVRPGLRTCEDDAICIDDLNAYIAFATASADAGATPDQVYGIEFE